MIGVYHLCGQRLPVRTLYRIRKSNIQYHPVFYHVPVQFEILKLPAASCRESSKCKEVIPFYCSSLANPAASYGECARWSIFKEVSL